MKTKKLVKRISSVALCLTVTAAAGFTGLTASAATAATLNFADYAADVNATNTLFESKAAYYWNDSYYYMDGLTPTDAYKDLDVWAQAYMNLAEAVNNTPYNNIAAISPKDASGSLVVMENFSATLDNIRVGDSTDQVTGAVWIGIRQQTPGKFLSGDSDYQFDGNQAFVRVTNTGITVASGQQLAALSASADSAAAEDYKFTADNTSYLRTAGNQFDIRVKVIGDQCTVTVLDQWNVSFTEEYTETLENTTPSCGYFTFGIGDTNSYAFNNVSVKKLDVAGNEMDFDSSYTPVATSVASVSRTVEVGAALADANLPAKILVIDRNGYKYMASVVWDTKDVDFSKSGVVTVNGAIPSTEALPIPENLVATARITVANGGDSVASDTVEYNFKPYSADLANSFLTTYADWVPENYYNANVNYGDLFVDGNFDGYTLYNALYGIDRGLPTYGKVAGLTPKDADGNLLEYKNFELSFDYRVPMDVPSDYGALWIVFHQQTGTEPGSIWKNNWEFKSDRSIVKVTNTGVSVRSDDAGEYNFYNYDEDKMSAESTNYLCANGSLVTVKVRVLENKCTVGVYKTGTDEVLYIKSFTLKENALRSGYITLGIGNRQTQLSKLTIRRIRDVESFGKSLQPYSASLADSFLTTWSHEGNYQSNLDFNYLFKDGWKHYTVRNYTGEYPFAHSSERWSRIAGITPIDENGKAAELRNFELTFDYRVPYPCPNSDKQCGAIFVGFRQKEAGHFLTSFATFNQEQSIVKIDNTGISIGSGSTILNRISDSDWYHFATNDDVTMPAEVTEWLASDGSLVTIRVKVVGNNCEVGIYNTATGKEVMTYSEALDPAAIQSGYLTLGLGDNEPQMINLTVRRLDESGNIVDFTEYTKGDVNGDSKVDVLDLVRIKKYDAKVVAVSDIFKKNADCKLDGAIDAADLVELKKILLDF